jgi:hypothetical protein
MAQRLRERIILDRVHRRTMADKQHGHSVHSFTFFKQKKISAESASQI